MDAEPIESGLPVELNAESLMGNDPVMELRERMYNELPTDGSPVPNATVRKKLNLSNEEYWPIRQELIDEKRAIAGKGRGGTVARLNVKPVADSDSSPEPVNVKWSNEADLYAPLKSVIDRDWQNDRNAEYSVVDIIAHAGSKNTGGKWTRPDLVAVEVNTYPYYPNKVLSVYTFEVKPADAIDVSAVYEALAHRRAATHSYLLLHVPNPEREPTELESVLTEARQHGIGVVVFSDPENYETWDERVLADRMDTDPAALNNFIDSQLSPEAKKRIQRDVR